MNSCIFSQALDKFASRFPIVSEKENISSNLSRIISLSVLVSAKILFCRANSCQRLSGEEPKESKKLEFSCCSSCFMKSKTFCSV
jgi:hypothetical protein